MRAWSCGGYVDDPGLAAQLCSGRVRPGLGCKISISSPSTLRQLITGRFIDYGALITFVDFFFLIMIGLGTIVWLLEVERDRVMHLALEIERLSNFDSMTGMPNRSRFLSSWI